MRVDYPPPTISGYWRIVRAGAPVGMSLRDPLRYAFRRALLTGDDYIISDDGDPCGMVGYDVARSGQEDRGLCWVAECRPDGTCVHHRGHSRNWDVEIKRAWNGARGEVRAALDRGDV